MNFTFRIPKTAKKMSAKTQELYQKQVQDIKDDKYMWEEIKKYNEINQKRLKESQDQYTVTEIILREEARKLDLLKDDIRKNLKQLDASMEYAIPTNYMKPPDDTLYDTRVDLKDPLLAGVAGGTVIAGSTVSLVALFCTAGTGTAISHLSGIYAAHAILAVLGGGTMAAGGLGVVGGLVVSSTLFVLPALAVGGKILNKKLKAAYDESLENTRMVDDVLRENDRLARENRQAADLIRHIYDAGIEIRFFFQTILNKFDLAPLGNDTDEDTERLYKIARDAKNTLGTSYLKLVPFNQENALNMGVTEKVNEIHSNYEAIQNALVSENDQIFTSRDINDEIHQLYEDAQQYIYMTYPWYSWSILFNKKYDCYNDCQFIESVLKRGVEVHLCYGIGKSKTAESKQEQTTEENVRRMKELLKQYPNFRIYKCNSHRKIMVCEKYSLEGSQNLMSYRYFPGAKDIRDEITTKFYSRKMIQEHKKIILSQIKATF